MNDPRFNPELYREHNENEFKKVEFICDEFPTIIGEILVAQFADGGTIKAGKNVIINSAFWANPTGGTQTCFLIKGEDAVIELGDGCGISNVVLAAKLHIKIGDYVNMGAGCKVFDNDFHSMDMQERVEELQGRDSSTTDIHVAPVSIEYGAFIGAGSIILKGVTIGRGSVIGAGSVVTKSVPPGEIWAGNPAKFIKTIANSS